MSERTGIVCAGNWIVDIVHDIAVYPTESDLTLISNESVGVGGGAANVAFNLAALDAGIAVLPVGALGNDEHSDTVIRFCLDAGLPVDDLMRLSSVGTGHTHVMNVPGGSRTFFYFPGANDHFGPECIAMQSIAQHQPRLFYLGYLNLLPLLDEIDSDGRTGAATLLTKARDAGMTTCVDLVSSNTETYKQTVFGTLPEIDWLFLNEAEASRATGIAIESETDQKNMELAATRLLQGGLRQGCILHTPQRSLWLTQTQKIWFDVPQLPTSEIISAVGAGDAFAAGVLFGLHQDWSPHESVQLGNKLAAACLRAPTATGGIPSLKNL